jgi:hypothetical protein
MGLDPALDACLRKVTGHRTGDAGLVGIIARPSRADGADAARDGGVGVKSFVRGSGGTDMVWSVIVS